jgi:hypothetical protein
VGRTSIEPLFPTTPTPLSISTASAPSTFQESFVTPPAGTSRGLAVNRWMANSLGLLNRSSRVPQADANRPTAMTSGVTVGIDRIGIRNDNK